MSFEKRSGSNFPWKNLPLNVQNALVSTSLNLVCLEVALQVHCL
jgi:hypothetical protein